jgi:L-ascorbate metabolism protein UlaG (beta-lactamase superfamily)
MTAHDAVELYRLIHPRTAIPIHYEGWKHFQQGREPIERELAPATPVWLTNPPVVASPNA